MCVEPPSDSSHAIAAYCFFEKKPAMTWNLSMTGTFYVLKLYRIHVKLISKDIGLYGGVIHDGNFYHRRYDIYGRRYLCSLSQIQSSQIVCW